MADGFLIGSAYVQVKPDTSTFKADLDADLAASSATATVKVSPDATGFSEKLRAAVAAAGSDTASVRITADTSGLDAGVASSDAKLDEVSARSVTPRLGLDSAAFGASIADAMAKLDDAGARSVTARLSLDDTGFKAKLDADMAELAAAGSAGGEGGGLGLIGAAVGGAVLGAGALPGALAGAGGAVGTLTLAFAGINTALTAYSAQAAQAAKATQGMGGAASSSSAAVRSAQQAVSAAETQQAHDAITSAESVKNAQAGVAQAVQQAAQSQVAAEQQVATAQYNEQQAQEALTAARAAAVLQIQALNNAEADTALSAKQAQLDLEQAQLNQQQTDASATATALQKAQAELSVEEAEQRLKESLQARTNAASAANTADKAGVEGSPGVIAAKHNVATAEQAQAAAAANLAQVEQTGAASIAKAQQGLADAERNSSWQRAADAQRVQGAQQSLAAAYASAAGGSAAATTAGNAYAAAMAKLSPASQQVVKDIISLKAAVTGLESLSANSIAPGLAVFLDGIRSLLPEVRTELQAMGGIISAGLDAAGRALESSGFQKDLADLFDEGNKFITVLGPAVGNLASSFVDLGARAGPAVAGLAAGLAGLLNGVSDLLRGLAPFSSQAGIILQVLGQAAGLLGGPLATAVGIVESAIAPLVQAALPAFASLAAAVGNALATLQPVVTQLAGSIGTVLAPSLAAIASVLGAGLDAAITGVADALTAVMSAIGPTATGAVVLGITAIVLGMKAWAAATALLEGSTLVTVIAGWVEGIATFVAATEGATIAEKAMLLAETAMDALNPFGWVALAVAGIAALGGAILLARDNSQTLTGALAQQNGAVGYNVAGWQKYETALQQANDKVTQVINTGNLQGQQLAHAEQMQGQYTAALQQTFAQLDLLNTRLSTVGNTYDLTTQQVVKLAEEAGISSGAFSGSAAAADKATQKLGAFIIANQNALAPQQEVNSLMAIFGSSASTAATQTAALNTAWQLLVGNFVSKQQAMLNASTAVSQYATAAKQAGGNTQALQQQFYSTIQQLQPLIDQISKTHTPMATLYQDLQNHIQALQTAGPLNTAEQQALQRLQQLADALANSTHGMTTAQQQAATVMESQLIPQLTSLGVSTTTAQADSKNLADAILNTGAQSAATSADRAQLISDLEKAGVNAQTATALVDAFIKKVATIQASKTTDIIVHGDGTYSVAGNAVKATAAGWLVAGGTPGRDSVPILAMPGELVVPTPLVQSGAVDHLRGLIPGFADGGVVSGNYSGALGGAGPFVTSEYNQTTTTIEAAVAAAAAAAMAAAAAASSASAGGAPSAGAKAWTPNVVAMLKQAALPASYLNDVLYQMTTESGGNPTIVNKTDSNWLAGHPSVGLMQVIQGTFDEWAGPYLKTGPFEYGVSTDPDANIYAALEYAKHGRGFGSGPGQIGSGHGYDQGGWLMPGATLAVNSTGKPERVVSPDQEKALASPAAGGNHFNLAFYGTQMPTPEQSQALMIQLATAVGAAG